MSAFFVVLLGSSGRTSPVVPVTGVSATGAVGTVSAGTELLVNVTGVFSTASVGQAEAISSVNALATGISAAGEVGIAIGAVESDALLTGVSSTGSIGTAVVTGTANIVATGVSAQADVGSVGTQIGGNTSFTAVGVSANASIGNVTVSLFNNVAVNLTGVSSTASAGTLVVLASARTTLSGVSATALLGTSTARTSVVNTVSGIQASASVGSVQVTTQQTTAVTGVAASGQVSGVTVNAVVNLSVNVTGVSGSANLGNVTTITSDNFIVSMMEGYSWDDTLGFGSKFANPSVGTNGGLTDQALKPKLAGETVRYLAVSAGGATGDTARVYQVDGINGWGSSQAMASSSIGTMGVSWLSFGSPTEEWLFSCNGIYGSVVTGRLRAKKFVNGAFSGNTQIATAQNLEATKVAAVNITSSLRTAVVSLKTTPFIRAHDFTTSFTGNTSSPSTLPPGYAYDVKVLPVSTSADPRAIVFVGHINSPYLSAYRLNYDSANNKSSFGTKYSNPSSLPSLSGRAVAISQNGSLLAVATESSPYISVYPWNTSTGFGAKYSNPATLPTSTGLSVSWRNNNILAVGQYSSPYLNVYAFNNGFGSRYSNPVTLMSSSAYSVTLS